MFTVSIIPVHNVAGKLADAELVFTPAAGALAGCKLVGFSVWRRGADAHNVSMPARQYHVDGERRSWALLRPAAAGAGSGDSMDLIKAAIIDAYRAHVDGYAVPTVDARIAPLPVAAPVAAPVPMPAPAPAPAAAPVRPAAPLFTFTTIAGARVSTPARPAPVARPAASSRASTSSGTKAPELASW